MTGSIARISYFKRYKMEIGLSLPPPLPLPLGFALQPWRWALLDTHASVLFGSFQREIDARVFPSLGDADGCVALMTAIARKRGFFPDATWLAIGPEGPCATVQGVCERGVGAIQNLGVLPAWRGRGLGRSLLLRALLGFHLAGMGRGLLEVTAQNAAAVRLYRDVGFRRCKTLYKAVAE